MNIVLKQITKNTEELPQIKQLYLTAFPEDERAPFGRLAARAAKPYVDWLAIFNGDACVGFFYNVLYKEDLVYIFYFAIEENLRGQGYGSAALAALKAYYAGKRLFLAMEEMDTAAENYAQRLCRKQFYEFNGFVDIHTKLLEGTVIYDVMSQDGHPIYKEEYHNLMMPWLGWWRFLVRTKFLD